MTKTICNLTLATIENIKQTTIAKDVSIILQKTILVFSSCGGEIKVFHRSLEAIDYAFARTNSQLQKTIFQNIQKVMVQQVFARMARCGYFDLFKFNQFKTLSSFVSAFKLSLAKISASISISIESCCSSFCVAVIESILNKEYYVKNLFGSKFTKNCSFIFSGGNKRITTLISLETDTLFNF